MSHTLRFTKDVVAELKASPRKPVEVVLIREGECLTTGIRPHVMETSEGPVEVADLFLQDGNTACRVPFGCFTFAE